MSWSPNFEENLSLSNGFRPNLEDFDQRQDDEPTLRRRNIELNVDEDVYENEIDVSDGRAEILLEAYKRKLGFPVNKNGTKTWDGQQDDTDTVEEEISNLIRCVGIDREPPLNYKPNSQTTSKSAIQCDRLPVAGVKDLYLEADHFKFPNPYFKSEAKAKETKKENKKKNKKEETISRPNVVADSAPSANRYEDAQIGVHGEEYVSPRQLYVLKAKRNR